ncbi:MAG: outer membrane protein assembly factor BamB [Planctomycetota bacterium]|jgi:outer membrane protein assembly factor BamB
MAASQAVEHGMKNSLRKFMVILLGTMLIQSMATGQLFRRNFQTEYFKSKVQIAGSRLATQNIEKAKKDIQSGEFNSGVRLIQETIDKFGDRALETETNRFVGIRDYCNNLIRELPLKGAEAYHSVYDPYAESLFNRGVKDHDATILKDVYYRYQLTPFGKRALITAISIEFEGGKLEVTQELALLYREIYGDDEGSLGPVIALILSSGFLGDIDPLKQLAKDLPSDYLSRPIETGEGATTVGNLLGEQLKELSSRRVQKKNKAPRATFFKNPQWLHELPMLLRGRRTQARCDDFGENPLPREFPWNPVIPVVDEGSVFVTNGVLVRALELYSKSEKWEFRGWVQASQARQNRSLVLPLKLSKNTIYASLETPLPPEKTIWTFVPQQQIPHRQLVALDSSTGKVKWQHYRWRGRTFAETEFVSNLNINSEPLIIGDRLFIAASRFHTSYHQYLCCFDRHNGNLLWSTFISTGQMEQNMFGNRVREAVCGQLVEKDGVIFHSTNIGVIAAVDSRLGTLKFTATYDQIAIPRQTRFDTRIHERAPAWSNNKPIVVGDEIFMTPMDCQEVLAMNRHNGKIRQTGIIRTRFNRYRYLVGPSGPWIVAAGSGLCFYNTETGAKFEPTYVFSSGRRGQSARSAGVVARPAVRDGKLLAPVNSRGTEKLLIWSINDQRVVDEITFPNSRHDSYLGNVTEKDGVFVTASTTSSGKITQIRCFYSKSRVKEMLEAAIVANPKDPKAHFRMGEFALQGKEKDYKSALNSFENARRLADEQNASDQVWTDKSRNALSRLYLELASKPRQAEQKTGLTDLTCFQRACEIATTPAQKVEILFLLLRRSYDRRDNANFDATYTRLSTEFQSVPYDYEALFSQEIPEAEQRRYGNAGFLSTAIAAAYAEQTKKYSLAIARLQELLTAWPRDAIGTATSWEYGYSRIEELIAKHGRQIYSNFDDKAVALFEQSEKNNDIKSLELLLTRYPNAQIVERAYNEISRRQFAKGDFESAAAGLHEYFAKFGQVTAVPLSLLARSLQELGRQESAYQVWSRILDLGVHDSADKDIVIQAKSQVTKLANYADKTAPPLETFGLKAELAWKQGVANGADDWKLVFGKGRRQDSAKNIILAQCDRKLIALSIEDGSTLWSMDAHNRIREHDVLWHDGLLLVHIDDSVVCIDPLTGEEAWRHDSGELRISGFSAGQGKAFIALEARGFPVNFRLRALSILDGTIVLERIIDGVAQGEGMECGTRWLMVPLASRLACLVIDGFTLQESKAWPEGADFDDDCQPFLSADGHFISIARQDRSSNRELSARDPDTGRVKWRRRIGEARVRFFDSTPWHTVYKIEGPRRGTPSTVLALDNHSGTSVAKHTLPQYTSILGSPQIAGNSMFAIKLKLSGKRNSYNLEEIDTKTNSTKWRSTNFRGNRRIESFPFATGVVLRMVERLRGASTSRRITTLYLVDRASGRIENEIRLDSRRSSHVPDVQVLNGSLIVTDGPVLKVFKP